MPCVDQYPPRNNNDRDYQQSCDCSVTRRENRELRKRLNEVTDLLCKVTDKLDVESISCPSLKNWIKDHRYFDAQKAKGEIND